jgi:Bacterial membrane protein YfhO
MTLRALSRRWPDLLAVLTLVALWLIFFWRLYTPTNADRLSISQSDFSSQYYNFSVYQARRFDAGTLLPLWNPYNYAGSPFLADPQAAVAYPVRWLFLALYAGRWSYSALEVEVMAHFLLTSLLMYALARQITGRALGGLVAAIAFTYGGYLNSFPIQQVTILESGTWLPLALLGIHQATRGAGRWGWLVVAGIGLGLVLLGGHPQVALLCGYFSVAYLGFRILHCSRSARDVVRFALATALFAGIGLGLAAIVLVPTVEFQQLATRATDLNYVSKSGGYPFIDVLQIIWSTMTNLYAPMYSGIMGLALAAIAVVYRRAEAMFWLVAGLFALVLGFGGKTALFQFAYTLIPGASLFRNQERTVMVWSFCVAILAGIGAAGLAGGLSGDAQKRIRYTLWGFSAFVFAYLLIMRAGLVAASNSALEIATYTVIVAVLVATILPWAAKSMATRQAAIIAILVFDLFSLWQGGPAYSPGSPDAMLPEAPWMADMRPVLAADPSARIDGTDKLGPFGTLYALPSVRGTGPLHLAGTERLLNLPPAKYWDLLAVRYVVSGEPQLPVPSKRIRDVNDWSGQYAVYELDQPGALARLIYTADVIDNDDYAAQVLAAPDYPVREKVVLPAPPPISLSGQRPTEAAVTLGYIAPEHLGIRATTSGDALLLISIPYHPGWKASANGQTVPVIRADLGLMAIPLQAGNYDITLDFRPTSFQVGVLISIVTTVGIVVALVVWVVLARRSTQRDITKTS